MNSECVVCMAGSFHREGTFRSQAKRKSTIILGQSKHPIKPHRKNYIVLKSSPTATLDIKKVGDTYKHVANLKDILQLTNATPIRNRSNLGYECAFCTSSFVNPGDLKQHTATEHEDPYYTFYTNHTMKTYSVKLDITDLKCHCGDSLNDLDQLIDHLTNTHNKEFKSDVKNFIMPFKFDRIGMYCTFCNNEYNSFKLLTEHMNGHYRNHVCEVCGAGFLSFKRFYAHKYRHKTGNDSFACPKCSKTFDTQIKQRDHFRSIHVLGNKRYKCSYCDERFKNYTVKKRHEIDNHGLKATAFNCQMCEKTFDNQKSLRQHTNTHFVKGKQKLMRVIELGRS